MTGVFPFVRIRCVSRFAMVAVSCLMSSIAHAQATPAARVLVMPFSATVDSGAPGGAGTAFWLGEGASILVGEGLSSLGVPALGRDDRVEAFEKLQLPMSPALTRATMIRVGEIVGATEVVFGDVHLGTRLDVRARTIQITTGRELPAVTDQADLADIFKMFSRVAGRLGAVAGRTAATPAVTTALPLETFESYVKGLVAATPAAQQRFLESAQRQAPADGRILMALWSVYREQGLHDKALAAANAVPPSAALVRRARFAVGLSLIDLKRFDGAFKELTALYDTRHAAAVSNALGVVQLRRGAGAVGGPATTFFARAVDEDPANPDYLFNLGYAHAVAQNAPDALTWLRETVRYDAANGDAHLVMSVVLSSTGRSAEAQRELELARLLGSVSTVPPPGTAVKVPTGLERLTSDLDASPTPGLNATIGSPTQRDQRETAAFHLARARDLIDAHKDRDAANELKRAVYLSPYEDQPHLLLGRLYQRGGQIAEAIEEFKVAIWCRETAAARVALGNALLESGEKDAARREADRALILTPNFPEARDLIRRIGS